MNPEPSAFRDGRTDFHDHDRSTSKLPEDNQIRSSGFSYTHSDTALNYNANPNRDLNLSPVTDGGACTTWGAREETNVGNIHHL
jgi:hypothetical protein